jgi:hypothetical protein
MSIKISIGRDAEGNISSSEDTGSTPVNTGPTTNPSVGFSTRVNSPMNRVTLGPDLSYLEEDSHTNQRFNMADSNAEAIAANPESIMATLRKASGSPRIGGNVEDTDRVRVGDLDMEVRQAIKLGYLMKDQFGNVVDNLSNSQASAQATTETQEAADEEPVEVLSEDTLSAMHDGTQGMSEITAGNHIIQALDDNFNVNSYTREMQAAGKNVEESLVHFDAGVIGIMEDVLDQLGFDVSDEDETIETWNMLTAELRKQDRGTYKDGLRQLVIAGNAEPLVNVLGKYHEKTGVLGDEPEGVRSTTASDGRKLYDVGGMMIDEKTARRLGYL